MKRRVRLTESQLYRMVSRVLGEHHGSLNEALGQETELYHATYMAYKDSFVRNGIDPNRAKGFGQGEGFYLMFDKNEAVKHAKSIENLAKGIGDIKKQEMLPEGGDKQGMIVVIREPLVIEDFDIDYELVGEVLKYFVQENIDEIMAKIPDLFLKDFDRAGLDGKFLSDEEISKLSPEELKKRAVGKFKIPKNIKDPDYTPTNYAPTGPSKNFWATHKVIGFYSKENISKFSGSIWEELGAEVGRELAYVASVLKEKAPDIFDRFEREFFNELSEIPPSKSILKYNGKRKIYPVRLETLDGQVIWKR